MKTNQNTSNNQSVQDVDKELNILINEAKNINKEIDETNQEATEEMNKLDTQINETIKNVEQIFSDLDQIEKEVGDEMDKLILEEAVSLSEEE
jgi:ElaB/YqjD/DUF883 family membrane-anchored ribosome-binding protein